MTVPAIRVACVLAAALILVAATQKLPLQSGLDGSTFEPNVRPQDDLYRYANARWIDSAVIPEDRATQNSMSVLFDDVEREVRAIIERLAAQPSRRAGSSAQQIVDLYTSVVDGNSIEARGITPLQPQLQAIERIDSAAALSERAGSLSATSIAGPFFTSLAPHPQNPSERVVVLSQGGLLLERDDYLKADDRSREIRAHYRAYLAKIFAVTKRSEPEKDADAVLALEISIAHAHSAGPQQILSVSRMMTEMPGFDWIGWAKPQGIARSMNVAVTQPAFFRTFAAMVATVPFETWRAWLAARYITATIPYATEELQMARFEFFGRFLAGQQAPRPRWKRGVSVVNVVLGDAIGRLYVAEHFSRSAKERVERIASRVLQTYRLAVGGFNWPTSAAKVEAQTRIAGVQARVGYPDVWRDYRGLTVVPDDLFGNMMRALKADNDRRMAQATAPPVGEWPLAPQTVNAFYNPPGNEIMLPAAILKSPYFDEAADDAVNFGSIGAVIGHEAGHALEESGRRIPAGMTVEGFNDVIGLSVAYRAYRAGLGGKESPVIDGLTGDQRFFLGWARMWRETLRPAYARQMAIAGNYPTGLARANGPVGHIDAFYAAFDVRPGDALFVPPAQRIRVF